MLCVALLSGSTIEGEFPILSRKGKERGTLTLRVQYTPLASIPKSYELENSYFQVSTGNRVTMYQDAHCPPPNIMPQFGLMQLPPGLQSTSSTKQNHPLYHPASCWRDLYEAIQV